MSSPGALSLRGWSTAVGASQSKIIDLALSTVTMVLAVVATVTLFVTGSAVGWVLGCLLVLGCAGSVGWLLRREVGRMAGLLTAYAGPRLILLTAAAAALVGRRPEQAGWVWTATGLAWLAVLIEPTIKVLLSKTEQVAVNLPGVRAVPRPPFSPDVLAAASALVAGSGVLLALLGAPGWGYLVPVLAQAAVVVIMIGHAARANLVCRRALSSLPKALKAYGPAFVLYYGGLHGARYQLGMWLPYLERVGQPFVVITREAATVPTITALTSAPVIVPRTTSALADLSSVVVPSMKAAFYVQGSRANLHFQKFRTLTHVWLNHGDSDKAANFSPRHATYDMVFVSGQQGVERYAAHGVQIPSERFAIVGRPQVEAIEVRDEVLAAGAPRTILYAPTWRGGRPATDYSSLGLGTSIVDALLERGVAVIFRPHPLSYSDPADASLIHGIQRRLEADRRRTGRRHVWGQEAEHDRSVADCLNAADGLITDVSSVASDNLASGKPFAMVAMRGSGEAFRREFPMARVSYVIEKDLSTLDEALDHLLGSDPLAEHRRAYRSFCLGEALGEHAADEFLRVAGQIISGSGSASRRRAAKRKVRSDEASPLDAFLESVDPSVDDLVSADGLLATGDHDGDQRDGDDRRRLTA